jgi:hypothetical protein
MLPCATINKIVSMRVLVGSIPFPQNRFFLDLNGALSGLCDIEQSADAFWNMTGDYDVVHLHFPEYLTYGLQQAYIDGLTNQIISDLATRLDYWSKRAPIVVTRHVLLPHDARHDPMWEKLYAVFYSFADAVAHFGKASVTEFEERYARVEFKRGVRPIHRVIPHQNYATLPNTITRDAAREKLGVPRDARVMLVFGALRSDDEAELVRHTFDAVRDDRKVLVVPRWREKPIAFPWIRARTWLRNLRRLYYRMNPKIFLGYSFVAEDDTQIYLNAADVLFIPRLWVLNSGNVTLGMTFGRVVVGPDSWDVGEILTENGNPVFDPDNPATASVAVERAFKLADENTIGPANRELALTQWTPRQCAELYMGLYKESLSARAT